MLYLGQLIYEGTLMKNKVKKIVFIILAVIMAIIFSVSIGLYIGNQNFRSWADKYVLKKNIQEDTLPRIDIEESKSYSVYAYSNRVVTLADNVLTIYNSSAKEVSKINMQVTTPKFASCGDYLLVADENQPDMYLIYNESLQWSKNVDGNISEITVNKNGAVGVVVTGTIYKSVIVMYDINGDESFKTYLSSTTATDIAISENAQYLSFVEINSSGTTITSVVKNISTKLAKENPSEAIVNTYKMESNTMVLSVKFKRENIVTMDDSSINLYNNQNEEKIYSFDKDTLYADINLDGYACYLRENTEKIVNGDYLLKTINLDSKKENTYIVKNTVKSMKCSENVIALNTGSDVEFVGTNGMLIKRYESLKNIKDVILTKKIAAIVLKDRIEIVNL